MVVLLFSLSMDVRDADALLMIKMKRTSSMYEEELIAIEGTFKFNSSSLFSLIFLSENIGFQISDFRFEIVPRPKFGVFSF